MNTNETSDYRFASLMALVWLSWLAFAVYLPYATFNSYSDYDENGMVASGIPRDADPPHIFAIPAGDDFAVFTRAQWVSRTVYMSAFWAIVTGVGAVLLSFVAWAFLRPRSV